MSFGKKLAQGFFRSAVNQVGRDGGKVISNKVYKGAHATPIYNAGGNQISRNNVIEVQQVSMTREDCENVGFTKTPIVPGFIKFLLYFTALIPVFGWFTYPFFLLATMIGGKVFFSGALQVKAFISDKRKKEGHREELITQMYEFQFPMNSEDKRERNVHVIASLLIVVLVSSLWYYIISN